MNFEYSPGLFGYGIKGDDGSAGITGAGLFFTNYDRDQDVAALNACISEDRVMWLGADPSIKLADGRTYAHGDLFIDKDGWLSEINSTTDGYQGLNIRLNTLSLFEDAFIASQNAFQRYQNIDDPSIKYIIDNIYSISGLYPSLPWLYGINPKNYARIEYSDIVDLLTLRNPFTVYSSGEIPAIDDNKSLALIRETTNNVFRIGNINDADIIRSTSLIFDVISLRKNTNTITLTTPTQEVISNTEINANSIFSERTNLFNYNPSFGLYASSGATQVEITWDLSEITPDPCVLAELHFMEASSRIILPIESAGSVTLSGLINNYDYDYYIKIIKDGWCRNTITKTIRTNSTTPYLNITDPTDLTLDASASGLIDGITPYVVQFDTNSPTWTVYNTNGWITCNPISGSGSGDYSDTFNLTVTSNTLIVPRSGNVEIRSSASPKIISVNQQGVSIPGADVSVAFTDSGLLQFSGLTTGVRVSVQLELSIITYFSTQLNPLTEEIINFAQIVKDSVGMYQLSHNYPIIPAYTTDTIMGSQTATINGIVYNTNVNIAYNSNCYYDDVLDRYARTSQMAKILSISFESGSGITTIGNNNTWRRDVGDIYGCTITYGAYHS